MANFFDQFDPPSKGAPAAPRAAPIGGNFFDQFDPAQPAAPVDPIRAQVRKEIDAEKAAGRDQGMGAARTFVQGATLGTADEILALGMTIPNMVKRRTLNPFTAYDWAKAKEDALLEDDRSSAGLAGTAAELLGGASAGKALYEAGATLAPSVMARLGGGVAGRVGGAAADGAAFGAIQGAAEGSGTGRLTDAAGGAGIGAAIGGALPAASAAVAPFLAPIASNVMARVNPAAYAERQIGRAAVRSGQTPEQIADRVGLAAAEGQGEYRLLDGLDYPGARLGAVVAKNPGEGRTELRNFLNERQEGQAYRMGNALSEGLDAPVTAQAATRDMKAARATAAEEAYSDARGDAGMVDTSRALERIKDVLHPGAHGIVSPDNHIAHDSVESALARARSLLTDGKSEKVGFDAVQRVKGDLDDAVGRAVRAGENNKARLLGQVTRELDTALEAASPSYAGARDGYRQASRNIEAVETGTAAAGRGRSEDKIAAFSGMAPSEQAAFRTGYADPLIARVQGAAEGANKARPFTSQAMQTELPAFAAEGRGDTMMRQIGRENEMFGNRAQATGGSTTTENFADNADAGIDPGVIEKILGGRFVGATKDLLMRGAASLNGNTEAVRDQMAKLLMEGDRNKVLTMLLRLGQQDAVRSRGGATAVRGITAGATAITDRRPAPAVR